MATRIDPDGAAIRDLHDRAQEARDANGARSNPYVPWRAFQQLIGEIDPAFLVTLCRDYQAACEEIETLRGKLEEATTTDGGE